jgi:cation diffusion facilitator family transporter
MQKSEKIQLAQKVTIYGAIIDVSIGVLKVIVGFIYSSHALIVDGIHSFSDLLTDFFVLLVHRFSHHEADAEHPYGHGRFETMGTVVMGILLVAIAAVIAYENTSNLLTAETFAIPGTPTLIVAFLSIVLKEWAFRFQVKVGKEIKSNLIIANAWHSRSDAFSSLAVLLGLVLAINGYPWMDTVMAIIVALVIAKIGWSFVWKSVQELVDSALAPELVSSIEKKILEIDGVLSVHNLRSRKMGDKAILDVNIEVHPKITVSEGHEIATYVSQTLIQDFEEIVDVTVHTDVADDSNQHIQQLLPLRLEVIKALEETIGEDLEFSYIQDIQLHYLQDKITVVIMLPVTMAPNVSHEKYQNINTKMRKYSWFKQIILNYQVSEL